MAIFGGLGHEKPFMTQPELFIFSSDLDHVDALVGALLLFHRVCPSFKIYTPAKVRSILTNAGTQMFAATAGYGGS